MLASSGWLLSSFESELIAQSVLWKRAGWLLRQWSLQLMLADCTKSYNASTRHYHVSLNPLSVDLLVLIKSSSGHPPVMELDYVAT